MNESEIQELMQIIAEKRGISAREVVEEIQNGINAAYENPTRIALVVPRKNEIPTINEVLTFLSQIILQKINEHNP